MNNITFNISEMPLKAGFHRCVDPRIRTRSLLHAKIYLYTKSQTVFHVSVYIHMRTLSIYLPTQIKGAIETQYSVYTHV